MQTTLGARIAIIALFLALLFSGCAGTSSQPTRFYRLDGQPGKAETLSLKPRPGQQLVGIGPIKLATYLDRPQIVERQTPHRLQLHEFDHWAGSLQENIVQVITDLMRQRLADMHLIAYPWHGTIKPDYEVLLTINRFEREGDRIWLQLRWSLIRSSDNRLMEMQRLIIEEPLQGSGVEAGVAAANRAVGQLSERIATAILAVD
ncbi:MAG: PqiC family protein [Candidatus Thiodiazotropha endolucinida]